MPGAGTVPSVAPKRKELDAQLRDLAERHDALAEKVQRLVTHTAVLAVALRDPEAVPAADLEAAVTGISEISFDPDQGDPEARP
jgi:hypothetical protein